MRVSPEAAEAAFAAFDKVFKGWETDYHVTCWSKASDAFDGNNFEAFEWLYAQLNGPGWQAFRRASGQVWPARQTYDYLAMQPDTWRSRRLAEFDDAHVTACMDLLTPMADLKPRKHGVSVVAISKVLHFWNPRLFVIVDDAKVWRWALAHSWLRDPLQRACNRVLSILSQRTASTSESCNLPAYVAVLLFAAEIVRANPDLCCQFAGHVGRSVGSTNLRLETYEAAAVEWLLLGLVELPPPGVDAGCG